MSEPPTAMRMQVRFWLPDGSVVEYRAGENTEVTETVDVEPVMATAFVKPSKRAQWKPRDVTIHGVYPVKHAPGYLTDEEREIAALRAEVARLSPVPASHEDAE